MHWTKYLGVGLALATLAGCGGAADVCAADEECGGLTLEDAMTAYWSWLIGGDDMGYQDDDTLFLPMPSGTESTEDIDGNTYYKYTGHEDVTVDAKTSVVMPMVAWIGETYDPELDPAVPDDDPLSDSLFGGDINVTVTLDDEAMLDPNTDWYTGPVYFDPVITYGEATDYGAVGAIFHQTIGLVTTPLPAGEHTLTNYVMFTIEDYGFYVIYDNDWTITVE